MPSPHPWQDSHESDPRWLPPYLLRYARLIAMDKTDRQIAAALGVSVKTLIHYGVELRGRLQCQSRTGVAVWYVLRALPLEGE